MLLCIFISSDSTLYFCWNTSFQHLTWAVQIPGKVLHLYVRRAALLDEVSLAGRLGLGGIWTALNIIVHHSTLWARKLSEKHTDGLTLPCAWQVPMFLLLLSYSLNFLFHLFRFICMNVCILRQSCCTMSWICRFKCSFRGLSLSVNHSPVLISDSLTETSWWYLLCRDPNWKPKSFQLHRYLYFFINVKDFHPFFLIFWQGYTRASYILGESSNTKPQAHRCWKNCFGDILPLSFQGWPQTSDYMSLSFLKSRNLECAHPHLSCKKIDQVLPIGLSDVSIFSVEVPSLKRTPASSLHKTSQHCSDILLVS